MGPGNLTGSNESQDPEKNRREMLLDVRDSVKAVLRSGVIDNSPGVLRSRDGAISASSIVERYVSAKLDVSRRRD